MAGPSSTNGPDAPIARPVPGFRRSIAIVIGVNRYDAGIASLEAAVPDARLVGEHLRSIHGFEVVALTDGGATKRAILEALADPAAAAARHAHEGTSTSGVDASEESPDDGAEPPSSEPLGREDRLLVYFAGHGVALNADSGPRGYLVPSGASRDAEDTFVEMSSVVAILEGLACRHVLVVLDCCFAGAFRWALGRDAKLRKEKSLFRVQLDRYIRDRAFQVLVSTAHDELAMDVLAGHPIGKRPASPRGADGEPHSPFANALLDALGGEGDLTGDGIITAAELYIHVRKRVQEDLPDAGEGQTPLLFSGRSHDRGEFVFFARPGAGEELPEAPALDLSDDPYRGLNPYKNTDADADVFFGRAEAIRDLLSHFRSRDLTAVVGPSGSGKSSLVQAGLLHGISKDPVRVIGPLRPGDAPFSSLARALEGASGSAESRSPDADLAELLRSSRDELSKRLRLLRPDAGELVLVIDQLEELVTMARSADEARPGNGHTGPPPNERGLFLLALGHALAEGKGWLRVVVTLRSDYEAQIAPGPTEEAPWLAFPDWREGRFVIPAFTPEELRQVIEGPAAKKTLFFEPYALVDQMIADVAGMPGALPLLSFSLSELFRLYIHRVVRGADERALLASDYAEMRGVQGALQHHAERMYTMLKQGASVSGGAGVEGETAANARSEALSRRYDELRREGGAQETLRRVLTRMISGSGSRLSRRHVANGELIHGDPHEQRRIHLLKSVLADERLVVTDDQGVEPAHDTLIFGWKRVTEWREAAGETLLVHRKLTEAAFDWRANRKDLWDLDSRLPQVLAMAQKDPLVLCDAEAKFVKASVERRRIVRGAVAAGVVVVLGVLGALAVVFYRDAQAAQAREMAQRALAGLASDPMSSLAVARDAHARSPSGETEWALRRAIVETRLRAACRVGDEAIGRVEHSADGRGILTVSNHAVTLLDAGDLRVIRRWAYPGPEIVSSATLVRDGGVLVLARREADVAGEAPDPATPPVSNGVEDPGDLWSADLWGADGRLVRATPSEGILRGPGGVPLAIEILDERTVLRDARTGAVFAALTGTFVCADPTGDHVMTDPRHVFELLPEGGSREKGDCPPPGSSNKAGTTREDESPGAWPRRVGDFQRDGGVVHDGVWLSPGGDRYVESVGPFDQSSETLRDACGNVIQPLLGHFDSLQKVAFSSDGTHFATFARWSYAESSDLDLIQDRTLRLWDDKGGPVAQIEGHADILLDAEISASSSLLATGSRDGTARVWDASSGAGVYVLSGHAEGVTAVSFSPSERALVTTDGGGVIRRWSTGATDWADYEGAWTAGWTTAGLAGGKWIRWREARDPRTRNTEIVARDGTVLRSLSLPANAKVAGMSPEGVAMAYSNGDRASVVSVDSGKMIGRISELPKPFTRIVSVTLGPEGKIALVEPGKPDTKPGEAPVDAPGLTGSPAPLLWRPGGAPAGPELPIEGFLVSAAFDARGESVAIGSGGAPSGDRATVFQVASGKPLLSVKSGNGWVTAVAFDPSGKVLVTGHQSGEIAIWDATTGALDKRISVHRRAVHLLRTSADGRWLISGSKDGTVRLFALATGEPLLTLRVPEDSATAAEIDPDGRHLRVLAPRSVLSFDIEGAAPSGELMSIADEVLRAAGSPALCEDIR